MRVGCHRMPPCRRQSVHAQEACLCFQTGTVKVEGCRMARLMHAALAGCAPAAAPSYLSCNTLLLVWVRACRMPRKLPHPPPLPPAPYFERRSKSSCTSRRLLSSMSPRSCVAEQTLCKGVCVCGEETRVDVRGTSSRRGGKGHRGSPACLAGCSLCAALLSLLPHPALPVHLPDPLRILLKRLPLLPLLRRHLQAPPSPVRPHGTWRQLVTASSSGRPAHLQECVLHLVQLLLERVLHLHKLPAHVLQQRVDVLGLPLERAHKLVVLLLQLALDLRDQLVLGADDLFAGLPLPLNLVVQVLDWVYSLQGSRFGVWGVEGFRAWSRV